MDFLLALVWASEGRICSKPSSVATLSMLLKYCVASVRCRRLLRMTYFDRLDLQLQSRVLVNDDHRILMQLQA